jgi:uncharacterized membrane protein
MRARGDRGQLVPLYALLVLLTGGALLLLAHLGSLAIDRARARTAADAAALAGAAEGKGAAQEVAQANGATLETLAILDDEVEVRVRVGSVHATARARRCGPSARGDPVDSAACPPNSRG